MKLISWNVNGIRACLKNGFLDSIKKINPDIICLQEVAINFPGLPGSTGENQFDILLDGLPGYTAIYGAEPRSKAESIR